ncbi:MAG: hypothetical protein IJJ28_03005, partial [Lentisphaeria bacterium]|nr:hypothetical protein [Lentisphaeria bacterium]
MYRDDNRDFWPNSHYSSGKPCYNYVQSLGKSKYWSRNYAELASGKSTQLRCPATEFKPETVDAANPTVDDWYNFQAYGSVYNNNVGSSGAGSNWLNSLIPLGMQSLYRGVDKYADSNTASKYHSISPSQLVWFADSLRPDQEKASMKLYMWTYDQTGSVSVGRPDA